MEDRMVTMKGSPLAISGNELKMGDPLPDCELVDKDLNLVKLSSYKGKVCIISCMPSLDTSVCDIMTRKFSEEAVGLGEDVIILAVSMDLPFAQSRWCIAADVENVFVLSDHRQASFGEVFGVLIKDLRLLARAVFVADKSGVIQYIEIVDELTSQPDYDAVLQAARKLL